MKETCFCSLFCMYWSMTAWITSNLILQGNMGRMGRPRCLLVWPVSGEKQKHAQSWCLDGEKEQGQGCVDPVLCLIDPHLWLVACLFSPSHKFPLSHLPSKLHAHCLCPSQCPSVPSVLARARRCCLVPSPIRQEKRNTKCRLLWRQQYGLTPSFGCCDGECKCVTGVHNLVWERREGLHLAIAVVLLWLQMVLITLSSLHNCGQTALKVFFPNSAWENHKTIK